MKDRLTFAIIAFLLGGIGIHRFYVGQVGMGIACILFCWTGIPALAAFITSIIWLLGSDEEFNKRYN